VVADRQVRSGLTAATPVLAGFFGIRRARFVLYDLASILIWAGTWPGLGNVLADAIEAIAVFAASFALALGIGVAPVVGTEFATAAALHELDLHVRTSHVPCSTALLLLTPDETPLVSTSVARPHGHRGCQDRSEQEDPRQASWHEPRFAKKQDDAIEASADT